MWRRMLASWLPRRASALAVGVSIVLTPGCGGAIATSGRLERARDASECARVPEEVRAARSDVEPRRAALSAEMPGPVRRVAEAARIDDVQLADRTRVLERVLLLRTEIDAALGELGCVDDQLEALQEELDERQSDFELVFTISSIATGALAAVLAGVLDLTHPDSAAAPVVGIVGGVASASLGILAFWAPDQTVELVHGRNLLRAVRDEAAVDAGTFSGFITRSFEAPRDGAPSPRDTLRASWRDTLADLDPATAAIFFGNGGRYDREMLRLREVTVEDLEVEVQLIRQDLELLLRFLYQTQAPE